MRRNVSVEIGLRSIDRRLAQKADFGELVQRVVDGGQRHRNFGAGRLFVKHFGGEVAIALAEQQPSQRHALARRPQADLAQHRLHFMPSAAGAAIDRLAQLFRVNRFADKPVECSLIAFSVAEEDAGTEALRILRLCESRSFLNRIAGGQRDKNSERVTMKFQLNNMLSPRWDLPLGRRGAVAFDSRYFNAIFDISKREEFEEILSEWRERMTAPHFAKARTKQNSSPQHSLL